MLKFPKAVRMNEGGFTLVELMIVVAIIGILAAVAIPNFARYQAKARQSEAKLGLAAAKTGMQSFIAEYQSPTDCLNSAGVGVDAGLKRFYAIGSNNAASSGNVCGPNGALACNAINWPINAAGAPANGTLCAFGAGINFFAANAKVNPSSADILQANLQPSASSSAAGTMAYTISAAGRISNTAASLDVWTIDSRSNLTNLTNGL